jgi:hypothetical protein
MAASPLLSLIGKLAKPSWSRSPVVTAAHVTQFWQRRTNVWRRITNLARGAERLRNSYAGNPALSGADRSVQENRAYLGLVQTIDT